MNQPDLGIKVIELRKQKGLTQEQLAEICEITPRTIQRIESGEVDPRSYTLRCLSTALEFEFEVDTTASENLWLAILHLSSTLCILVIPLLLWSWKKNQSIKIDRQGRQVLNFQITMTLLLFAAGFLLMAVPIAMGVMADTGIMIEDGSPAFIAILVCSPLPLILIGIFCTIQGVINTIRSLSDKPIRYPLSIPFVK